MFLSFLYPYHIRGVEAPYLWVYYKQLNEFKSDEVIFWGDKSYFRDPILYKERTELNLDVATSYQYKIPDKEKIDGYNNIIINSDEIKNILGSLSSNNGWTSLMLEKNKLLEIFFEEQLKEILESYNIEAILTWCNCVSLETVAEKYSIPVIHNEVSPFRAPCHRYLAYWDLYGVGGNTSAYQGYKKFKQELEKEKYNIELLSKEEILSFLRYPNKNINQDTYDIGVALQVENDSNVLVYSNDFTNEKILDYAKRKYQGKNILIRKHPGGYKDYQIDGFHVDHSDDSQEFCMKCKKVISINSSVILEAFLLGKEVEILGQSPFNFILDLPKEERDLAFNYFIYSYLMPYELLFNYEYYKWRIEEKSPLKIFIYHKFYYLKRIINELKNIERQKNSYVDDIAKLNGDLLEQYDINRKLKDSNSSFEEENHRLENRLEIFQLIKGKNTSLESELRLINRSRGMRFLKKYYGLRDAILPQGSKRRNVIKNIYYLIDHARLLRTMATKDNVVQALYLLKNGDFNGVLNKITKKIESSAGDKLEKIEYCNDFLASRDCTLFSKNSEEYEDVDILIPIYNAFDYTVKCIESVLKNTDVKYNLWLLNDNSSDTRISEYINSLKKFEYNTPLQKIKIIENKSNLGFVKNINNGLRLSTHDVVILNTDTEVPENWLSRLISPRYRDNKIASITPNSNCATICSFPNFCEDNILPKRLSVSEVDSIFALYGGEKVLEIPTGVGFCMFMSREAINRVGTFDEDTFGKGYGEENDWCRRCVKSGYINVMINNLFVYHKHGASFGEVIGKSKLERIAENSIKLNKKHPEYDTVVQTFISEDKNKIKREYLDFLVWLKNEAKKIVLYLNHSMGGGAEVYLLNEIKNKPNETAVIMAILGDNKTLKISSPNKEGNIYIDLTTLTLEQFTFLLRALSVQEIFVNELCGCKIPKIIDLIKLSGYSYSVFIHDFFPVCPSLNLINNHGVYCEACSDENKCNECLRKNNWAYRNNIDKEVFSKVSRWRKLWGEFLLGAKSVTCPSENTKKIIAKYYPNMIVHVKEHKIRTNLKNTYRIENLNKNVVRIGFVGAISYLKGSKIIYSLVDKIRDNNDNIEVVIIGYTDTDSYQYKSEDGILEITGPYDNKKIDELLEEKSISIVSIPSIWPETFSYTTSESILSGYPVISFDIGAGAERIRQYDLGWCIEEVSVDALYEQIRYLNLHRDEIRKKVENCQKYRITSGYEIQ